MHSIVDDSTILRSDFFSTYLTVQSMIFTLAQDIWTTHVVGFLIRIRCYTFMLKIAVLWYIMPKCEKEYKGSKYFRF